MLLFLFVLYLHLFCRTLLSVEGRQKLLDELTHLNLDKALLPAVVELIEKKVRHSSFSLATYVEAPEGERGIDVSFLDDLINPRGRNSSHVEEAYSEDEPVAVRIAAESKAVKGAAVKAENEFNYVEKPITHLSPFQGPSRAEMSPEEWTKVVHKFFPPVTTELEHDRESLMRRMEAQFAEDATREDELFLINKLRFVGITLYYHCIWLESAVQSIRHDYLFIFSPHSNCAFLYHFNTQCRAENDVLIRARLFVKYEDKEAARRLRSLKQRNLPLGRDLPSLSQSLE